MTGRTHRLPNYFATQSMYTLRQGAGIGADDARGLLLLAAYRLTATLERLAEPAAGDAIDGSWEVGFPVGLLRVSVVATITDPGTEPVPDRALLSARDGEFLNVVRAAYTEVHAARGKLDRLEAFTTGLVQILEGGR